MQKYQIMVFIFSEVIVSFIFFAKNIGIDAIGPLLYILVESGLRTTI